MRPTSRMFLPLFIVAGLCGLALIFLVPHRSGSEVKLREIRALLNSVPVYPDSREIDSYWYNKPLHTSVGKYYRSNVDYDQLKHYYIDELVKLNWRLVGEQSVRDWWRDLGGRELMFQSGDYTLTVNFAGEKAAYGWQYSISITS